MANCNIALEHANENAIFSYFSTNFNHGGGSYLFSDGCFFLNKMSFVF